MKSIRLILLLTAFCLDFNSSVVQASTLYGGALIETANFFTVDQTNGNRTAIGGVNPNGGYRDLASDWRPGSFRLWAVQGSSLVRIDPTDGSSTVIGPLPTAVGAIAFDITTEKMFGSGISGFYEINTATGAGTLISDQSNFPGAYPSATLGVDLNGNLFAYSFNTQTIINIDKSTGAVQSLGSNGTSSTLALQDLAARPEDGVMFAVAENQFGNNRLYSVNTATGVLTPVGSDQSIQLWGLAFSPAVPEPCTAVLLAAGLIWLTLLRR